MKKMIVKFKQAFIRSNEKSDALKQAKKLNLFDPDWYNHSTLGGFTSHMEAFEDYVHKSKFSNINPSPAFDGETYLRHNPDVYHAGGSPLLHYLYHGRYEGRIGHPAITRWSPKKQLVLEPILTDKASKLNIAISLHIFYPDFIQRFKKALERFPVPFDLYLTLSDEQMVEKAQQIFGKLKNCRSIQTAIVPNRGRNFGPMLVEFGPELMKYDLLCHLHSKKSLYSGREQTQWCDYMSEYLLRDPSVVTRALNAFAADDTIGTYYPISFWMMPSWVNHWTRNRPFTDRWIKQFGSMDLSHDFINYPVGGMFWARPEAITELLDHQYTYEDFPAEPLPSDGSELHALERLIGLLAERNGFHQLYYYPNQGCFTEDGSYIFMNYNNTNENAFHQLVNHEVLSFDLFDTLLRRRYSAADYAKLLLGKRLCDERVVSDPADFVKLRNSSEFEVRQEKHFQGDVTLNEIYDRLATKLNLSTQQKNKLLQSEFEIDYDLIEAKPEMIDLFNRLADHQRELYIITDTYYDSEHITAFIRKIGITAPYRLLVSSEQKMRKDNLTMWHHFKTLIEGKTHVHIGDNVVSDAQLPGDIGLTTYHILHPMDKWQALGFSPVLHGKDTLNESHIVKWGPLVSNTGRSPFIGE